MVSKEFTTALVIYIVILAVTVPTAVVTKMQPQFPNGSLSSGSPAPGTGAYYYDNFCAGCHGPLASSTKLGRNAAQISGAISNVGAMHSLSSLNATQIQAIADALNNPPAASGGSTSVSPALAGEGVSVYAAYCSGCHGPLITSAKLGRSAAQIEAAISSVSAMNALSSLTTSQIDAVAAALSNPSATPQPGASIGPAPAPATLYAIYCASCHGPLASSSVRGASAGEIREAISETRAMNTLSSLSTDQIQAIASALQNVGGGGSFGNDSLPSTSVLIVWEMRAVPLAALGLVMMALAVAGRKKLI